MNLTVLLIGFFLGVTTVALYAYRLIRAGDKEVDAIRAELRAAERDRDAKNTSLGLYEGWLRCAEAKVALLEIERRDGGGPQEAA